ncbi:MAG: thioredoxin family protein [Candidatus Marinimicrobia bacterium]|jgi:peroxiredoxin|nr:thioredoxin family protein [Candidatus Neomarinimicrobiota bacterium]MBT4554207.1 thioredoxin family protein [Candidatus Neomarinimicrobiota bacterium]MBT4753706.1 thioredoxin family protein [Candidatus Neomarinimicrobiota bacterium]MBT6412735.1 thioredoxin family protein [Candidatus Neomarinimicrobiota bacterium]MBT6797357.1 thioredoxin family protein [Candidatus Neomarinimicrobiota bacterium]
MKIILSIMTGITFLIGGELEIGSAMPLMDHQLADISGKNITLANAKGDAGTLVIFSCNTCPWVIRWEDRYVTLANTYAPKGIGMIAVNSNAARFGSEDSLEEMVEHAKNNGYNFPYAQDPGSKLATAFGATKTPHIYLFNADDKLVYLGAIDDNAKNAKKVEVPFLANAIDALLAGKPINPQATKALGCSIKFN